MKKQIPDQRQQTFPTAEPNTEMKDLTPEEDPTAALAREQSIIGSFECALAFLRGEAGGYTPEDAKRATNEIQRLLTAELAKYR